MQTKTLVIFAAIVAIVAACATVDPHPMDMTHAIESATTADDHKALAKHYEEAAADMRDKADEHRAMLRQYESRVYRHSKQAQSLHSHCRKLIQVYRQAADENLEMAKAHREMAAELR